MQRYANILRNACAFGERERVPKIRMDFWQGKVKREKVKESEPGARSAALCDNFA